VGQSGGWAARGIIEIVIASTEVSSSIRIMRRPPSSRFGQLHFGVTGLTHIHVLLTCNLRKLRGHMGICSPWCCADPTIVSAPNSSRGPCVERGARECARPRHAARRAARRREARSRRDGKRRARWRWWNHGSDGRDGLLAAIDRARAL
jgi:hypothetical protein